MSETVFEWQGKELITIGDLNDAMSAIYRIEDEEERQRTAGIFMDQYRVVSGYNGHDTMVAMLRLFSTSHPIFGPPAFADQMTQEGALELGKAMGEAMRLEAQN